MVGSERILIRMDPKDIHYVDKVLESIDNLAILSVLSGKNGVIAVQCTTAQKACFFEFLNNCGKEYEIVKEMEILD